MTDDVDVEVRAARMDEFLKDETVQTGFRVLTERAYKDFLTANSDEARREAQAMAKAVGNLEVALRAVVGEGERARTERERRERDPDTRHFAE